MKKKFIVKNNRDFDKIIKTGKRLKNKHYIIYYKENNLDYNRFGISVSKKLGNAVFRNKYKRKIRSIVDNYRKTIENNFDYVIIMRREMINLSFKEMEESFQEIMNEVLKG